MKVIFATLRKQSSLVLILLATALFVFGSVMKVTIAGVVIEIPDLTGRIAVWATGFVLLVLGITWKRNRSGQANSESQQSIIKSSTRNDEILLASILEDLRGKELPSYVKGITVGKSTTLRKCPQMEKGWRPSEVELDHTPGEFRLPKELENAFEKYYQESYKKEHGTGRDETIMLTKIPIVGSDRPGLRLTTQSNQYCYSQFYWNVALLDEERYHRALADLFEQERISFPHNLCIHLVVLTKDEQLLLTRRSKNVGTHANTWSCSIEENLKPEDLQGDRQAIVERWMTRAIFEELGVKSEHCRDLKVLSLFLEGEGSLNISLAGLVVLNLDRNELSQIINLLPRRDYEFADHAYMTLEEAAMELRYPGRAYHPTSGYRILMALMHRFGEANFARKLVN